MSHEIHNEACGCVPMPEPVTFTPAQERCATCGKDHDDIVHMPQNVDGHHQFRPAPPRGERMSDAALDDLLRRLVSGNCKCSECAPARLIHAEARRARGSEAAALGRRTYDFGHGRVLVARAHPQGEEILRVLVLHDASAPLLPIGTYTGEHTGKTSDEIVRATELVFDNAESVMVVIEELEKVRAVLAAAALAVKEGGTVGEILTETQFDSAWVAIASPEADGPHWHAAYRELLAHDAALRAALTKAETKARELRETLVGTEQGVEFLHARVEEAKDERDALAERVRALTPFLKHKDLCGYPEAKGTPLTELPLEESSFIAEKGPCDCGLARALAAPGDEGKGAK